MRRSSSWVAASSRRCRSCSTGSPAASSRRPPSSPAGRSRSSARASATGRVSSARRPWLHPEGGWPSVQARGAHAPLGLPRPAVVARLRRAPSCLPPAQDCGGKAAARTCARVYSPAAMRDRADRWDYLLAGALGILTVLSRLPYRARMLYNWDGVQFALALREYDVVKHQPHPPGYILYVGLGRVVNAWLHDPTAAYVLLAVAFSGLTTCVVYLLARAVYDRATALAGARVLAVRPLVWFSGPGGRPFPRAGLF